MASSDYPDYGRMHAKSIFLSEDGVRLHDANDDSKTITLKGPSTYQAGNQDITLPDSSGALLNSSSDLDYRNLHHANLLASVTPADGDKFMIVDVSDSESMKAVSGTQLKAYCSTSLSPGDIDNANLFAAGVVDSAALAANSVTATELQDNTVTENKLQNGAVSSGKLAANAVNSAAIADDAVTAAKISIHDATDIGAGLADADSFLVNDSDDTNNVKRVTGAALKTFIGSSSLSAGDIDNSNLFAAGVVDSAALAANSVTATELQDNATTENKLQNGAVSTAKIQNDAVTSDKLAAAVALDTSIEAPIMYFGSNQWRMQIVGGDLVMQKWNGVDTWVTHHTFDSGA